MFYDVLRVVTAPMEVKLIIRVWIKQLLGSINYIKVLVRNSKQGLLVEQILEVGITYKKNR